MLKEIQIKHYKCFKEARIPLANLTVLAGSNSSGKSSTIQAILLSKLTIEKLTFFNILDEEFNKDARLRIPLNGRYALALGNTQEVLRRNSEDDVIAFRLINNNDQVAYLSFNADISTDDIYNLCLREDHKINPHFQNFKNEFYYLAAERIGPRLIYDVEQQDFSHVGFNGEYTIQVIAQKKEDPIIDRRRMIADTSDVKLLNQVRHWMKYVIPGFYIDSATLEGKLQKAFTTYSESSPTNVGFGISYVLPIIVNCLVAQPGSIVIIENPEAHLHPKGQSNLGYFLGQMAGTGLQIITETHSEHVINGMRRAILDLGTLPVSDFVINFFSGVDEMKSAVFCQIKTAESGDLTNFPRDFFDQVQQDMAELFRLQSKK